MALKRVMSTRSLNVRTSILMRSPSIIQSRKTITAAIKRYSPLTFNKLSRVSSLKLRKKTKSTAVTLNIREAANPFFQAGRFFATTQTPYYHFIFYIRVITWIPASANNCWASSSGYPSFKIILFIPALISIFAHKEQG